jgi:hypothetical protein
MRHIVSTHAPSALHALRSLPLAHLEHARIIINHGQFRAGVDLERIVGTRVAEVVTHRGDQESEQVETPQSGLGHDGGTFEVHPTTVENVHAVPEEKERRTGQ